MNKNQLTRILQNDLEGHFKNNVSDRIIEDHLAITIQAFLISRIDEIIKLSNINKHLLYSDKQQPQK